MNERIFLLGYCVLVACVVTGIIKYRYLDSAMRLVLLLFCISLLSEAAAFIAVREDKVLFKSLVYNLYSIVEVILVTAFFTKIIKPYHHKKLLIGSAAIWIMLNLLNIIFLQSIDSLNTNILMLESFSINTMCLYFIYWTLKNNVTDNIFTDPYFWVSITWLLFWSGTFFFWAFIKILYSDRWPYLQTVITMQGVLLLLTYCSFLLIFLLYPKNLRTIERN